MIFDAMTYAFIVIGLILSVAIFRLSRSNNKNTD
jgi:hypothetical protein